MVRKQLKIGVLCNYKLIPNRIGGMDYFFWEFDKKCRENNVDVIWIFPNNDFHNDYAKMNINASDDESIESFFVKKFNQEHFDYIITHFLELCTPFYKKIKKTSNKIITVDHNPRPIEGYSFKKRIEKKMKGILYSKYIDLFIGVSEYTVNEIINDFGGHLKVKTKTIYNGVVFEDILIRETRNTTNPTFLVASHLRFSKGIQDLIEAVHQLPKIIISNVKIDIYGSGPYEDILKGLVKQYNLHENIIFKGSRSNLKEIFCKYDYMLQPTYMECFSLSILESLAANVPVITTNVGGNEEAVENKVNGYIFRAKDINGLCEILTEILLGKSKIEMNTRSLVEQNFSINKMVENHFNLLK